MQEEIKHIVINFITGEINNQELVQLSNYLKSNPRYKDEVFKLKDVYDGIRRVDINVEHEYQKIESGLIENHVVDLSNKNHPRKYFWYKVASIVLIISVSLSYLMFNSNKEVKLKYEVYSSLKKENSIVTLDDGTTIYLAGNSKLKVPENFSEQNRNVELDGQATFDVDHNPNSIFTVHTKQINVKVLGTNFNVRAYSYEKQVSTTLKRGKVLFEVPSLDTLIPMEPNQKLVYEPETKALRLDEYANGVKYSWEKKSIVFKSVPFNQIIKGIELFYNKKIIIQIKDSNEVLSCSFINKSFEQVMESLSYAVDFKIENKNNKIILK